MKLCSALILFLTPALAGQMALEDQVVVPTLGGSNDAFGGSIEIDGERMIVGSRGFTGGIFGKLTSVPLAHIFVRGVDGGWTLEGVLDPPASPIDSITAMPVALDGDWAFVRRDGALSDMHIYHRDSSGTWSLAQTLTSPGSGWAQDFAADAGRLLIGRPLSESTGINGLLVFERGDDDWYELVSTVDSPTSPGSMQGFNYFGSEVELQGDRAIVTADGNHVFEVERDPNGQWVVGSEIGIPEPFWNELSFDGDRIAISRINSPAHVLVRQSDGSWEVEQSLFSVDWLSDTFGTSADIDGDWLAVGASTMSEEDGPVFGSVFLGGVYLFRRDQVGSWELSMRISASDAAVSYGLGAGVAVGSGIVAAGGSEVSTGAGVPGSVAITQLGSLFHTIGAASVSSGGEQELFLRADAQQGGERYLLLGTLSGTQPATAIPGTGFLLPLVVDAYTLLSLRGGGLVADIAGQLAANGSSDATAVVRAGLPSALAGLTVHHAFVTIASDGQVTSVSNAVALDLVP